MPEMAHFLKKPNNTSSKEHRGQAHLLPPPIDVRPLCLVVVLPISYQMFKILA